MSNYFLVVTTFFLLILFVPVTNGQPTDTVSALDAPSSVTFVTDIDSARVVVDGSLVGFTPVKVDTLPPGLHEVRIHHPDMESWLTESITDSINIAIGKERVLRYAFVPRYLIQSAPDGADILMGDSLAGITPSVIRISSPREERPIRLRKEGYELATISLAQVTRGVIAVDLSRTWHSGNHRESIFREDETNGKNLRLYITGAATVLSGVASAYFKVQADNRYDDYLRSGNPALRSETSRLDAASGVALAITQLGLGLFTYFLLSE
ncbi:MAG TPA: PEGA domain-containing protein [Bacteroidota bacterium]|nr:PEGA domain-containing protein [Bacteroidota bacterium]